MKNPFRQLETWFIALIILWSMGCYLVGALTVRLLG